MAFAARDETATIRAEAFLRTQPSTTSTIQALLRQGAPVSVVCWARGEPSYGTDKYGSMWLYLAQGGWVHSIMITSVNVPPCTSDTTNIFDNCDEARDAGAAPIRAGRPGYGLHLDRDRDGAACDPGDEVTP